jgi:YHS domain-containing protein
MSDLQELERRIEEELSAAQERRCAQEDHQRRSIIEFQQRHERYAMIAGRVLQTIIRPRVHKTAEYFKHAGFLDCDEAGKDRCALYLGHTPRFPTTAKLELTVSRDAQCETLIVLYDLEILPIFFPFQGSTRLILPLGRVNDENVAAWVDDRLVSFVETYLRVEAADQYDTRDLATDPVCGMRINQLYAAAKSDYEGQTYYFCLEECRGKFAKNPRQYLAGVDLPVTSRNASVV